jgi:Flp pilus assembly protein TadG
MFARRNRPPHFNSTARRGTTIVETAVVLPVFLLLLFAIFEFGHAQLINNMLNSACRNAARIGAVEGSTTAQVRTKVQEMIGSVVPTAAVQIFVKNASSFDGGGSAVGAQLEGLPDIELKDTESRTLFVVRAKVPYRNVAIVPMPFLADVELDAQAFMRHE